MQKIESHDDSLKSEASFSNAREMTRHELEIEQSLYRGTKKADELKHLVKAKTQGLLFLFTQTCFFSLSIFSHTEWYANKAD